jgi:uncharacterized membrane protein YqhA
MVVQRIIHVLSQIRFLMLAAAVGSLMSALLMFFVGFDHLYVTLGKFTDPALTDTLLYKQITIAVLEAVDAFLFGIVFIIFAYAITIGFVFQLPDQKVAHLPRWMKVEGVSELKQTLVEVVIVGLIILFAGVAVEQGRDLGWDDLVLPIGIVLLAAAMRLLHTEPRPQAGERISAERSQQPPTAN